MLKISAFLLDENYISITLMKFKKSKGNKISMQDIIISDSYQEK